MRSRSTRPSSSSTIPMHIDKKGGANTNMKKFFKLLFKILGKALVIALIGFVVTFAIYITNSENKLIYYVVRPFLNRHYDTQVRNRKI